MRDISYSISTFDRLVREIEVTEIANESTSALIVSWDDELDMSREVGCVEPLLLKDELSVNAFTKASIPYDGL